MLTVPCGERQSWRRSCWLIFLCWLTLTFRLTQQFLGLKTEAPSKPLFYVSFYTRLLHSYCSPCQYSKTHHSPFQTLPPSLFSLVHMCVNMHTHVCLHSVFRSCIIPNSPLLCSSAHGYFYFPSNPFPDKFPPTLETHLEYNMHYWIFPNSPTDRHIFLHLCLSIRFFFHW